MELVNISAAAALLFISNQFLGTLLCWCEYEVCSDCRTNATRIDVSKIKRNW